MFKIKCIITEILLLLLVMPSISQAQNIDFGVQALSSPDGIVLMIGGPMLNPDLADRNNGWIGYNFYRQTGEKGKFKKLNKKPISRVGSLEELEAEIGDNARMDAKFIQVPDTRELWTLVESNDDKIQILGLIDLSFREALGLFYRDRDVKQGQLYGYAITKVNADGKESSRSEVSLSTYGIPLIKVKGPGKVNGKAEENRVRLDWEVNLADTMVFSFSIYRSEKPDGPFRKINNKPVLIFYQEENSGLPHGYYTDTTVVSGVMYYYAVVGVDFVGNESPKEPVLALQPKDDNPPAIPRKVKAVSSSMGVMVTWEVSHEADLAGFNIYRGLFPDSQFVKITSSLTPADTGFYDDKSALANVQYYYRVTSVDRSGNESLMSPTGFAVFENIRAPLPPNGITASGTPEGVLVTWQKNTESDLRGYYVFRAEKLGGDIVQISALLSPDTVMYQDDDKHLSPKGTYWYYLKALNYSGLMSSYSVGAAATPAIIIKPEPPSSFYGYQDVIGNRLFWQPPTDNTVVSFNIYRAIKSDSLNWKIIIDQPLFRKVITFTDSSAVIGIDYLYRITSINDQGIEGRPSHAITLNRFAPPPLPPGNVMVTKIENGLQIAWDPTMEKGAAGYIVYRRLSGEKIMRLTDGILPSDRTEFRDLTAKSGNRYFYSISCVDQTGREGARSPETTYMAR